MPETETAMSSALRSAGVRTEDVEFDRAIARYLDRGGTIERAHERVDIAAQQLSRGGQKTPASDGLWPAAIPGQPQADGGGLCSRASDGHISHATSARPQSQGAKEAQARVKMELSVFDRELTRTGQMWGNVHYCELEQMVEDAEVAAAVRHHLGVLAKGERLKQLRELLTPLQFTRILTKVRKHAA